MSETLAKVQKLVLAGEVEVSQHGLFELAADSILLDDVVAGIDAAIMVEEYAEARRGPSVLALHYDRQGNGVHVVWGIPKEADGPAVLITAYRPNAERWSEDLRRRKR